MKSVLVGVIAIASVLMSSCGRSNHTFASASNVVVVEPPSIDHGSVIHGGGSRELKASVRIENRSQDDLLVSAVASGCSCTTSKMQDKRIPANGSVELETSLDIRGIHGRKKTEVVVRFEDGSFVVIPVQVDVTGVVAFVPEVVRLRVPSGSSDAIHMATITRYTEKNLHPSVKVENGATLKTALSGGEFLEEAGSEGKFGVYRYHLSVDPSQLDVGHHVGVACIRFDDGVSADIPYEVIVGNLIECSPEVSLAKVANGEGQWQVRLDYSFLSSKPEVRSVAISGRPVRWEEVNSSVEGFSLLLKADELMLPSPNRWYSLPVDITLTTGDGREQIVKAKVNALREHD